MVVLSFSQLSYGQLTVQNTLTPEQIVQNVLLGNGVAVSNIQWNGSPANAQQVQSALGEFGGTSNIGIPGGVILSCGNVAEATGPNSGPGASDNSGIQGYNTDPEIISLQPPGTIIEDGGVLEFDFTPSGDTISFEYVFASEEYPEFAPPNNANYNDAFGFFLSGPNPAGGSYTSQNLAVLPGTTTIVGVNSINAITNQQYYLNNDNGLTVEYDGFTTPLRAVAAVSCNETYHIKLVISDAGDPILNSAVFLERNSFSSNGIQVAVETQTGDSTIVEGCVGAEVNFIRPTGDIADTLNVDFTISGTAINGTDYTEIISPITFMPGEDTMTLVINPLNDGVVEVPESIEITTYTINPCGDTIVSTSVIWIIEPSAEVNVNDTIVDCPNPNGVWLVAEPVSGVAPYSFLWSDGSTNDSLFVSTNQSGNFNYTVTMTDFCGENADGTGTVTVQEFNAASFIATPESGESPLDVVFTNTSNDNGVVSYDWSFGNGLDDSTSLPISVNTIYNESGDYEVQLTVTNDLGCIDSVSKIIHVYVSPSLSAPNVFTPNNDGANDVFEFFNYKNIHMFNCTIVNRWGNVMIEFDDIEDVWDGRTLNGNEASGGVYFYAYTAQSLSGITLEGHGFFHLIRDED